MPDSKSLSIPADVFSWETSKGSIGGGASETRNESRMEENVLESVSG